MADRRNVRSKELRILDGRRADKDSVTFVIAAHIAAGNAPRFFRSSALAACRKHKARLVIAKLDRLSRNVMIGEITKPYKMETATA